MLNRQKTSADVEIIVDLYEKDKALLTAMLINIREIIIVNQPDDSTIVAKLIKYLNQQGIKIPEDVVTPNKE